MTTTTGTMGSAWSASAIYSGWGEENGEQGRDLGNAQVDEFHKIAKENNSTAYWCPHTSEVICDVEETDELIEQYDSWREQAVDAVGVRWADGEFEMDDE